MNVFQYICSYYSQQRVTARTHTLSSNSKLFGQELRHYRAMLTLQPYSGQGFENSHQQHQVAWKKVTSSGGLVSKMKIATNPIEQLMTWQCHRLLLSLELPDKQWTPIKKKGSKRQKHNQTWMNLITGELSLMSQLNRMNWMK